MAVPKKKISRSKRDSRRASNSKIVVGQTSTCSRCGQTKHPHRVCGSCGYYKNEQVLPVEDKAVSEE
jgi:large subunit ribosomal protein L32